MVQAGRRAARSERLRVAVLMGGPSSEHEISLQGGALVAAALDPTRHAVRPVVIGRDGTWRLAPRKKAVRFRAAQTVGAPALDVPEIAPTGFDGHDTDGWPSFEGPCEALVELKAWGVDLAFPVLHGAFGEDGRIQALLEAAGIDFVGSRHAASALAFDKIHTKEVLRCHGIATPDWQVFERPLSGTARQERVARAIEALGLPLVLKNPLGGSSLEVVVARDEGEVLSGLDDLWQKAPRMLLEAFVHGTELTAAVLEDFATGTPRALPIVEIRPRHGTTFDYFEKYNAEGADEICPAPLPEAASQEAQQTGLRVHRLLGLRGLSRTDLRRSDDGTLQVLEVNTLPGMTERGLLPLAAAAIGIDFGSLVAGLARTAT